MKCTIAKSDICSTKFLLSVDGLVKMESYMEDFASKFDPCYPIQEMKLILMILKHVTASRKERTLSSSSKAES